MILLAFSIKKKQTKNFDPMPFLKPVKFKCLSAEQKEDLRKEIISEIKSTIDNFLPKKVPGMDYQ